MRTGRELFCRTCGGFGSLQLPWFLSYFRGFCTFLQELLFVLLQKVLFLRNGDNFGQEFLFKHGVIVFLALQALRNGIYLYAYFAVYTMVRNVMILEVMFFVFFLLLLSSWKFKTSNSLVSSLFKYILLCIICLFMLIIIVIMYIYELLFVIQNAF